MLHESVCIYLQRLALLILFVIDVANLSDVVEAELSWEFTINLRN